MGSSGHPGITRRSTAARLASSGGAEIPHSDACFVKAYPGETTEAFCDGHVSGFSFFGGVPRSILYDNTRIAVARILGDGKRQRTRVFSELRSHYLFEDRFGRPGSRSAPTAISTTSPNPEPGPGHGASSPRSNTSPDTNSAAASSSPPWIATKSRPGNSTKTPIAHAATWKTASRTANSICSPIA